MFVQEGRAIMRVNFSGQVLTVAVILDRLFLQQPGFDQRIVLILVMTSTRGRFLLSDLDAVESNWARF